MPASDLSVLFAWAAVTALTTAMIAFAIDLSRQADQRTGAPPGAAPPSDVTRPRRAAGAAMATTWVATVMLIASITMRGVAAGRAPWSNMYEFTLVGACTALLVFVLINLRRDLRFLGTFVTGIAALFVVLALNAFYVPATGLFPALQSYWLVIHVGVAVGAAGIFTVAFILSMLQLLADQLQGRPDPTPRALQWVAHLPAPAALEALSFRLNAVGFVAWTFTLIGGAIWAEDAWGRYWGWDPKEVWTFVIWVVYAAYLHARMTRGWAGRRSAYFVLVGYTCVIFNFTVVNLVINGKHSYSGLTTG
ncbi:c-type cytochrome biogenesis protein CcsB [Isoptericola sp. NPDC019482]|uniref:c-type cytochrome biogenesis protein CcsB n=1 Tax=Isoptericola sp. NPDC019482 TaxID=3154688 RepID=UPI003470B502